ncbi:MAG TPA: hypothetical protein VFE47_07955 [Tepidisphaeraceae bacterium]|jgi:hypothetical protein|nr:hypothetical protein [Tepidisphaeraceae bacterium]
MNEIETFVRSILGTDIEQFDYAAGGYEWIGWKKLIDETNSFDSDAAMKIVNASWRACHAKDVRLLVGPNVLKSDASVHANRAVPVFAQIFALPQLPVIDVIELCDVGSHNSPGLSSSEFIERMRGRERLMSPENRKMMEMFESDAGKKARHALDKASRGGRWKQVRHQLEKVMKTAPFEIQSADAAGLRATFLSPISKQQARKVGKLVLEVNSDVMDVMESELEELNIEMNDDQNGVPDYESAMGDWITAMGGFKLWWD